MDETLENANTATPCVIYAAKSTEDKKGSILAQLEDCREMAARKGWRIVGEFSDEGFSAYSGNRGDGLDAAKSCAAQFAASEAETAMLLAQHSDRLARGAGDAPGASDSLGEIWHAMRRLDVHLRSVQNDFELSDPVLVAVAGKRDHEDSRRKSDAVQDGLQRSAERGEWSGGILADGYALIKGHDEHNHETRRVEYDPERKPIWDLVWDLARGGYSANAIVAELDKHGYVTCPRKRGHKPRAFDANRVRLALNNPFYAGLRVHRGEVVGNGNWPRYVEPEDFYRLISERRERAHVEHRKVGRPVENYLLAGVGRCHECGSPMDTVNGAPRKDGSRPLRYVCRRHRERRQDCNAKPFDALAVDDGFLNFLPFVLSDVAMLNRALATARQSNRGRLETEAKLAHGDREKANKAKERMAARIANLYADDEHAKAEALEDALGRTHESERAAEIRLQAALDALAALPDDEGEEVRMEFEWPMLKKVLLTRFDSATGDVKRLNLALTEFLESVTMGRMDDGRIHLGAQLRPEVVARLVRDRSKLNLDPWLAEQVERDPEAILGHTGLAVPADGNPRSPW